MGRSFRIRSTFSGKKREILASSITSMNAWASSPERYSNTSTSSRSEKMDFIRAMRSSVGMVGLISFFQAGGLLDIRTQSTPPIGDHQNERKTDDLRRTCKTSETSGRE